MNRREFSKAFGMMSFGYVLGNNKIQGYADETKSKTNKSIVFVFLGGGIGAADSFIIKPNNTLPEYAPVNGFIQTKSDYMLGSNFQKMATISDKMNVVYNYKTYDGNHNTATAYSLTGKPAFGLPEGASAKEPSAGSLMSYVLGTNNEVNGLPTYVKMNRNPHLGQGYLSSKYMGFDATEDGIKTLKINSTPDTFLRRNQMVNEIELGNNRDDHYFKEWSALRNQAKEIVTGNAAKSFDLSKEDPKWVDRYNASKNEFGKNCLLARRLVEAGSSIITIQHDGWDMHSDISAGFNSRSTDLDAGIATLTEDLAAKGMLDKTMIIITSEFSRTKMNATNGRDHNPNICSLVTIGGPSNGRVIGECDKFASVAEGNPFGPKDLFWTMFNWLDIQKNLTIIDNLKRPRHIFSEDDRNIFS